MDFLNEFWGREVNFFKALVERDTMGIEYSGHRAIGKDNILFRQEGMEAVGHNTGIP